LQKYIPLICALILLLLLKSIAHLFQYCRLSIGESGSCPDFLKVGYFELQQNSLGTVGEAEHAEF